MRTWIALLAGAVAMSAASGAPAFAQEETFVSVKSSTTVRAEGLRLMGRVSAPFAPRGDTDPQEDCVGGREVGVSIKRRSGYRLVGAEVTSEEGRWSLRVKEFDSRYRITIAAAEFSYSPRYGQLETVRCLSATLTGRLGRRGFRVDSVLGERFGRAAPATSAESRSAADDSLLPATGWPMTPYVIASLLLMGLGLTMTGAITRAVGRSRSDADRSLSTES